MSIEWGRQNSILNSPILKRTGGHNEKDCLALFWAHLVVLSSSQRLWGAAGSRGFAGFWIEGLGVRNAFCVFISPNLNPLEWFRSYGSELESLPSNFFKISRN